METQSIRLRLVFEDRSVLSETQRSDGMNQSWLLIEPNQHRKISDVCNHVLRIFNLRHSCPNGILLYMEGFVLPPSESTKILKDKEILCVKRKEMAMAEAIEGIDEGNLLDYEEANRKEPVNNGMLLLANEEFDKETGGYKSESEEEKLEDEPSPIQTVSKKRKASTKLKSSNKKIKPNKEKGNDETDIIEVKSPSKVKRKKKHHLEVEGEIVRDESCIIDDVTKKAISKKKIKQNVEINNGDVDLSGKKVKSPTYEKRIEHLQENVIGVEQTSTNPDEDKKGPSRSARRKKAKRQWRRELAKISEKPDIHQGTEVSKAENKEANGHQNGLVNQDEMPPTKVVIKNTIVQEERKSNGNGNSDSQLVACVVKPGHIRFEPLDKDEDEDAMQIEIQPDVGFQWNGITSKKKGQKWGLENNSTFQKSRKEASPPPMLNNVDMEVLPVVDLVDFEKLPLCTSPKEGDVIAYRLVELSSSWTPELSSFRVGKISHYEANNIILKPVPEYPIVLGKMDEDGPDDSLYKEDGTLEIQFAGLVDVRSVKKSNKEVNTNGVGQTCQGGDKDANTSKDPTQKDVVVSKKKGDTWDEVMEALNAKKSELLEANEEEVKKDSEWNRWSYRALRGSALGPTMALLRSNNNI